MNSYLRLLEHLSSHLDPWLVLSEACMEPRLSGLHGLALEADPTDTRSLFHEVIQRSRRDRVLGPLFQLLRSLSAELEPTLGSLTSWVFEQPHPTTARQLEGAASLPDTTPGSFDLVIDCSHGPVRAMELDRWMAELIESERLCHLRALSAHGLQLGRPQDGAWQVLVLASTARDYQRLCESVHSGRLVQMGSHWICNVGRFRPADDLEEATEVLSLIIEAPAVIRELSRAQQA